MLKYFAEVDRVISMLTNLGFAGGPMWYLQICSEIMKHLATCCPEFEREVMEIRRQVRLKQIDSITLNLLKTRFLDCERTHNIKKRKANATRGVALGGAGVPRANLAGGVNVTQIQQMTAALSELKKMMPQMKKKKTRKSRYGPGGPLPAGSCKIHPDATCHTTANCPVTKARAANGWTEQNKCTVHEYGVHTDANCYRHSKNKSEFRKAKKANLAAMRAIGVSECGHYWLKDRAPTKCATDPKSAMQNFQAMLAEFTAQFQDGR